jgi:RNA 2',3'-cyclic 3'-phosphodiesterase
MLESVPAFLALNLEVAACRRLAALQRDLRTAPTVPSGLCWISPTNLRIVLRSLGTVDPALSPAVLDPVREWIAGVPPIRLLLGPVAAFPSAEKAKLITVQIGEGAAALHELAERVGSLLSDLGLPPQKQPFHPHLTLARLVEPVDVQGWFGSVPAFSCDARVTELAAYVHAQKRAGAEHVAIDRFAFAPPPRTSQRPSKAPRQPSQRPSKRPKLDGAAPRADDIPSPPRVPNIPMPSAPADAPVPDAPTAAAQPQAPAAQPSQPAARSSILPPALEASLPPDDEWGS